MQDNPIKSANFVNSWRKNKMAARMNIALSYSPFVMISWNLANKIYYELCWDSGFFSDFRRHFSLSLAALPVHDVVVSKTENYETGTEVLRIEVYSIFIFSSFLFSIHYPFHGKTKALRVQWVIMFWLGINLLLKQILIW